MKVFSKQKMYQHIAFDWNDPRIGAWANECDGKPVRDGKCFGYGICDEWCIEVPDDVSNQPRYKIVIEGYKSTTLATMYVDDKVIKRTAAKRHPADKFNFRIGAQTAFNRLWEKKKQKPVVREVVRPAKRGEWVRVVKAYCSGYETYKTGDVLKVERPFITTEDGWVYLEGHNECACAPFEYVVLEGYKPE